MHVCCCWIQEGRVAKDKQRLQQKLYSNNALFKKKKKRKKRKKKKEVSLNTLGHCPLPTDFFCALYFWATGPKKWHGYITQPTVNNTDCGLSHLKSVQWFNRHLRQAPRNTRHTLSAICRCCQTGLFGQGFYFFLSLVMSLSDQYMEPLPLYLYKL